MIPLIFLLWGPEKGREKFLAISLGVRVGLISTEALGILRVYYMLDQENKKGGWLKMLGLELTSPG